MAVRTHSNKRIAGNTTRDVIKGGYTRTTDTVMANIVSLDPRRSRPDAQQRTVAFVLI